MTLKIEEIEDMHQCCEPPVCKEMILRNQYIAARKFQVIEGFLEKLAVKMRAVRNPLAEKQQFIKVIELCFEAMWEEIENDEAV